MNVLTGDTKILETNGHNKIKLYPLSLLTDGGWGLMWTHVGNQEASCASCMRCKMGMGTSEASKPPAGGKVPACR